MLRTAEKRESAQSERGGGEIPEEKTKLNALPSESGGASGGTSCIWELQQLVPTPAATYPWCRLQRLAAVDHISTVEELEPILVGITDEEFPLGYEYMFIRQEILLQSKVKITSLVPVDDSVVNPLGKENSFVLSFWKTKCINMMNENSPTMVGTKIEKIQISESSSRYKIYEIQLPI